MSTQPTVFQLGAGAVLSIVAANATSGTAATPVRQIKSISFAGKTASYEDITNMDSPAGVAGGAPVQEFAPTTVAPGTAALQGVFDDGDAGQILLAASQYTQTLLTVTVQFKPRTGQTVGFLRTFSAYVMECNGPDAQFDKASTLSGTLKISGPMVDVAGH